ncbi:MAG: AAA family ATPase [Alphaproteobacteria bacterium]|jgi:DNA polymerase-3 subunit delta'|nr:AAA family ATPase [Alphaproteobacteria bacterium]
MAPRKKTTSQYSFPHPMDNEYLVGHGDTLKNFVTAWENRDTHPLHPVWMLTGPKGIGKATLAYKIAKMVYGNVGDFFIIDQERNIDKDGKPKPDGKVISVYTVRAMIDKMQMSSMSGNWRVILIDSVDQLNIAASNAILKLLEEPPAKTLFLLIVHQLANVLPTVRSRARVEKMRPLSISQLRDLCAKFIPEEDINTETLRLSSGSFGKIANIKTSGGDTIYTELIDLLQQKNTSSADIMAIAKKIAPAPELYSILLDAIATFGLADLYPRATIAIADIKKLNLEPEIAVFKIIMEIKKCL